nr:MAG TPA: Integrase [Caudoviricetes sp.]
MATISKRPYGTYEVQWRIDGNRHSKTFKTRKEAKEFALQIELNPRQRSSVVTFAEVIKQYAKNETPKKKGAKWETFRLNRLAETSIAQNALDDLTPNLFQKYVDRRLKEPAPTGGTIATSTVIRELSTISCVLSYARKLDLLENNPLEGVKWPQAPEHRERVASEEEQEAIILAAGWDGKTPPLNSTQLTALAFILSCRTGMRAGEILAIEKSWIDGNVIHLPAPATKTNSRRDVALSSDAKRLLDLVIQSKNDDSPRVFSRLSDTRRDALWRKLRDRAGLNEIRDSAGNVIIEGLNFHDGRATFATWAASPDPKTGAPRLDVLALARQTGHKNIKMLMKYYRASAEDIAKRLG